VHVKFIARGTGSAGAAVDYLLGERDAAGELRAATSAQRSIEADMAAWTGRTKAALTRVWLLTTAAGLSVLLAICGGG
jgi:hypothetical protein